MAQIVDTRYAGGEFVVLGDALTLPTASNASTPSQGSLRYNPDSGAVEVYVSAVLGWTPLGGAPGTGGPPMGRHFVGPALAESTPAPLPFQVDCGDY